jgi:hypothetical protein
VHLRTRVAQSVEPLIDKEERRTREEEALCRLLLRLIEDYQQTHRAIPRLSPNDALTALLEARNLRQAVLLPRKLAEFFSVSPELFI